MKSAAMTHDTKHLIVANFAVCFIIRGFSSPDPAIRSLTQSILAKYVQYSEVCLLPSSPLVILSFFFIYFGVLHYSEATTAPSYSSTFLSFLLRPSVFSYSSPYCSQHYTVGTATCCDDSPDVLAFDIHEHKLSIFSAAH